MNILVAGAGAGKTSSMAEKVLARLGEVTDGKLIYVITYTNAARDSIRNKIKELHGEIPRQVLVETSHAFLIRELIFPFHHHLYEGQYTSVSQIRLSDNQSFKAFKIKELKANKVIHVEKVNETAKWIIFGKSGDKKIIKHQREAIKSIISRYLDSVFIDEAQDSDDDLIKIVESLESLGIEMFLVGDPKQDLRGRNSFRTFIENNEEYVEYLNKNHRCPISHVNLSNKFVVDQEKQIAYSSEIGEIGSNYENDIDILQHMERKKFDYKYIIKKNDRFITHKNEEDAKEKNLIYELRTIVKRSSTKDSDVDKCVYILKKWILRNLSIKSNILIFREIEKGIKLKLTKQDMGKLGGAIDWNREKKVSPGILVNSIDSIKGLEGEKCLFILTTEIADYFFKEKTDQNKMMNYLYVALTRSKKELEVLITVEVEEKYGRPYIEEKLNDLGIGSIQ